MMEKKYKIYELTPSNQYPDKKEFTLKDVFPFSSFNSNTEAEMKLEAHIEYMVSLETFVILPVYENE